MIKCRNKGFTLIELLITIVILGILSLLAFPTIRRVMFSQNSTKYSTYGKTLLSGARFFTDQYRVDMFGDKDGCYDITYEELKTKNLIQNINIKDVSCANKDGVYNTFVRVIKSNKKYHYYLSLKCKKGNATTYDYLPGGLSRDACTDPTGIPLPGTTMSNDAAARFKLEIKSKQSSYNSDNVSLNYSCLGSATQCYITKLKLTDSNGVIVERDYTSPSSSENINYTFPGGLSGGVNVVKMEVWHRDGTYLAKNAAYTVYKQCSMTKNDGEKVKIKDCDATCDGKPGVITYSQNKKDINTNTPCPAVEVTEPCTVNTSTACIPPKFTLNVLSNIPAYNSNSIEIFVSRYGSLPYNVKSIEISTDDGFKQTLNQFGSVQHTFLGGLDGKTHKIKVVVTGLNGAKAEKDFNYTVYKKCNEKVKDGEAITIKSCNATCNHPGTEKVSQKYKDKYFDNSCGVETETRTCSKSASLCRPTSPTISAYSTNAWTNKTIVEVAAPSTDLTGSTIAGYQYCIFSSNKSVGEGIRNCTWKDLHDDDPSRVIDAAYYHIKYPDLKNAFHGHVASLVNHYNQYGRNEGRQSRDASWLRTAQVIPDGDNYVVFRGYNVKGAASDPSPALRVMFDTVPPYYSGCFKRSHVIWPQYKDDVSGIYSRNIEYWSLWNGRHSSTYNTYPAWNTVEDYLATSSSIGVGIIVNIQDMAGNSAIIDLKMNFDWCVWR